MKRSLGSSDSVGALMSICPNSDEHSPRNNNIYSREFESLLDGYDEEGCCVEESGGHGGDGAAGKKRRLSVDQVKALEKNFEVENKLEPDRKVKLAQELGLQPRQVAVWFQNRRARWKTKQLEKDYGVLKTSYETLKANFNTLQHDNEALLKEIRELKAKINGDSEESNVSVKEEVNHFLSSNGSLDLPSNNSNGSPVGGGATVFPDLKDGSSDSDSSAILNEEPNNNNGSCSSPDSEAIHLLMSPTTNSSLHFNSSSSSSSPSSIDCFQLCKTIYYQPQHYQQYVKMEEHDFISSTADEVCNFFSDEQAPSPHWYSPEQWI